MRFASPLALGVLVASLVIALAGCGGDNGDSAATGTRGSAAPQDAGLSRAQYEARLRRIAPRVGSLLFKQATAVSRAPSTRLARLHIARLQRSLRRAAARVAALRPPASAQRAQRDLVAGLQELARELGGLTGDPTAATRPFARFSDRILRTSGLARVRRALLALQRQGYRLTPSS